MSNAVETRNAVNNSYSLTVAEATRILKSRNFVSKAGRLTEKDAMKINSIITEKKDGTPLFYTDSKDRKAIVNLQGYSATMVPVIKQLLAEGETVQAVNLTMSVSIPLDKVSKYNAGDIVTPTIGVAYSKKYEMDTFVIDALNEPLKSEATSGKDIDFSLEDLDLGADA